MNNYIKSQNKINAYASEWERIEKERKVPSVYNKTEFVEYKEFAAKILEQNPERSLFR